MKFDFDNALLPPVYKRNNADCYLDPIRKRLVYVTPEETVRQKVIYHLINELEVPPEMIAVEERLSHFGIESNKRADILILGLDKDGNYSPIAVIECKAPGVCLGDYAATQVIEYSELLLCSYVMLVNDCEAQYCRYDNDKKDYIIIEDFPKYKEMLEGYYVELPPVEPCSRTPFNELEKYVLENREDYSFNISTKTPMNLAVPAMNLLEAFWIDTERKMPSKNYQIFTLIEDYGIRVLSYGNASGGVFSGAYRSFLIEYKGNTEFVSFGFSSYCTYNKPDDIKTCLNIGIDTEESSHHSLQLVLDDNVTVNGDKLKFYHHGRIAVGNIGSGKIEELRIFTESIYPKIVFGNKFYLGCLTHNRLWTLDDPEVVDLFENLISYALIRDEYRKHLKSNNKAKKSK